MRRATTNPDADPLALDEETVERLLAGDLPPAQVPPGYGEVASLLAAMTAAPTAQELAGQQAALHELQALARSRRRRRPALLPADRRTHTPPRHGPARGGGYRRLGLAAVLVGALATGGVAAAASGHLPAPVREATRSVLSTLGVGEPPTSTPARRPPSAPGSTRAADATSGTGSEGLAPPGPRGRTPASTTPGAAAANPNVDGLCQAYLSGQGGEQGKKLDAAAQQALAELAGGASRIAAFCADRQPGDGKPENPSQHPPPNDQGQGGPPTNPPTTPGGGSPERGASFSGAPARPPA